MKDNHRKLINAIKEKNTKKVIEALEGTETSYYGNSAFSTASEIPCLDVLKILFDNTKNLTISQYHIIALKAAKNNYLNVIEFLFKNVRERFFDISEKYNSDLKILETAVSNNSIEVVNFVLNSEKFDKNTEIDYAVSLAAENGYIEVLKLLLKSDKINNYDYYGYSLIEATKNNHFEIIKILFENKNFTESSDLNYSMNESISYAFQEGYMDIVSFLFYRAKDYIKDTNIHLYNKIEQYHLKNKIKDF